jgi:hypothetical protein
VALQRLNKKPDNTWLLRLRDPFDPKFPGNDPNCHLLVTHREGCPFVISKVSRGSIQQRLISHDPLSEKKEYVLMGNDKNKVFATLEQLLNDPNQKLLYPADLDPEQQYSYSSSSSEDEDRSDN